jgi:hypothetical protein
MVRHKNSEQSIVRGIFAVNAGCGLPQVGLTS